MANDADHDVQAASVENFLIALKYRISSNSCPSQVPDGGEDNSISGFARKIRLELNKSVHCRAEIRCELVLPEILYPENLTAIVLGLNPVLPG